MMETHGPCQIFRSTDVECAGVGDSYALHRESRLKRGLENDTDCEVTSGIVRGARQATEIALGLITLQKTMQELREDRSPNRKIPSICQLRSRWFHNNASDP